MPVLTHRGPTVGGARRSGPSGEALANAAGQGQPIECADLSRLATPVERRGELCGLRWSDADLDAGTVTVASTRVVARDVVGEPKTQSGARIVSLDPDTVKALQAWRRRQLEDQLAAGEAWEDHGLVFADELGRPPHPETVTRWWREAVAAAGVPAIRLTMRATVRPR